MTAAPGAADGTRGDDDEAQIRTFLIADVRGYTLFTHERGDEAAAKLAARFAEIAREGVEARGGVVPLANFVNDYAFSARVGNVQINPEWQLLLTRLWVR